jgi:hypothetical protein
VRQDRRKPWIGQDLISTSHGNKIRENFRLDKIRDQPHMGRKPPIELHRLQINLKWDKTKDQHHVDQNYRSTSYGTRLVRENLTLAKTWDQHHMGQDQGINLILDIKQINVR